MDQSDRILTLARRGMDREAIAAIIGVTSTDVEHAIRDSNFDPVASGGFTGGKIALLRNPDVDQNGSSSPAAAGWTIDSDVNDIVDLEGAIMAIPNSGVVLKTAGVHRVTMYVKAQSGAYTLAIALRHNNEAAVQQREVVKGVSMTDPANGNAQTAQVQMVVESPVAGHIVTHMVAHSLGGNVANQEWRMLVEKLA